ncbi:hypothetical protein H1V43_27125 [Streptomyces sp. PSKA54]|uniref:Uncharacterized protein n=1 Tax=Streptomyces himalayensis subsp. aureolus TaxID=2758039 RepID=A0A7W2HID5_9ACTN|nr:hypothetical protein [Streptomyces himalayensis]MBA4864958.1 hypothetical protein [Streptomyces himalayensis subsp. aureolus]
MFNEPQPNPISDGPVEAAPRGFVGLKMQRATLLAEFKAAGVELGEYDRRIVDWLAGWDYPTVATIASLIRRAAHGSN